MSYDYANFFIDFYKVDHISQYPKDTTWVLSNWTPRYSRGGTTRVVNFGLQYFIKAVLQEAWEGFFNDPKKDVIDRYREVIQATLGIENPRTDHLEELHDLGYLPIDIFALPEGYSIDVKIPTFVIGNTHPKFFWLPNFLETIGSNVLWKPATSATTARMYRKIFTTYAKEAGETDLSFVDWQGHDFSFRGMSGREDAILSGMGHLLSFNGTDTIPAILAANRYYGAPLNCGGSVPATEHSVMCAGAQDCEFDTFKRLITEVYPKGIVSIVSDTWDLWQVLTEYIPKLKDEILARDGKVVIRPDSGDPVNILCGDKSRLADDPAGVGVLRLLASKLGTEHRPGMLPLIKKAGAIYGDSITLERARAIMHRTVKELRLSPYNVVLGIGSYTYEYTTRDVYGFAMKATAVCRSGKIIDIFKKPVTDSGVKNSLVGVPAVYEEDNCIPEVPVFRVTDHNDPTVLKKCAFRHVYSNGELLIEEKFDTIRKRVRDYVTHSIS